LYGEEEANKEKKIVIQGYLPFIKHNTNSIHFCYIHSLNRDISDKMLYS